MEKEKMKNMIVLKDLPSNIVDEAFVILKPNKRIKYKDIIKNDKGQDKLVATKYGSRDYMVKEAEMVIANYISNIEKEKALKSIGLKELEKKYRRLKMFTYMLGFIVIVNGLTVIL